jgi:phenylacetate-CoA ligase
MARYNNKLETPLKMKLAFSYGEVLTPSTRKFIEGSFSCPVFQLYGSTEFGPIAFECPEERKLHINSNSFILELADSNGKPSKTGEVLVTSLVNRTMPLIRYRIGDWASWGKCSCGRTWPVLDSIKGRVDDFATLPSGKLRSAFSFFGPYKAPNLKGYQIVQETRERFIFKYSTWPPGITETSRKNILDHLRAATLGEDIEFELQEVDELPKESTGKLRHFISKLEK